MMTGAVASYRSTSVALRIAVSDLLQEKLRLALSVIGVGLALMLILLLLGLRAGALRAAVLYLSNEPGSVEVLPQGVQTTAAGVAQFLTPATAAAVSQTEGVAEITPVLLVPGFADLHGRKEVVKLVGYDAERGGGPWDLAAGRQPLADDEVVLDDVLADRHDLGVGSSFELGGLHLRVVGLSKETSSWTGSYVFVRRPAAESLVLAPGASSFLLVTTEAGTRADEVVRRLRELPNVEVLLKDEVMANDQAVVAGIFDQVIRLMAGAAFIVGVLVVGAMVYASTSERRTEYGILRALGARPSILYRVVGSGALIAAAGGSILGVALARLAGELVMRIWPQFLVIIEPWTIALSLGAGVVMALFGAFIPARLAARLAPADVFRR